MCSGGGQFSDCSGQWIVGDEPICRLRPLDAVLSSGLHKSGLDVYNGLIQCKVICQTPVFVYCNLPYLNINAFVRLSFFCDYLNCLGGFYL